MNSLTTEQISELFEEFGIKNITKFEKYGDGLINGTYLLEGQKDSQNRRFIAQIINPLFEIPVVMNNIKICQNHIKSKASKGKTLHTIETIHGENFVKKDGQYWRVYDFIEKTYTINKVSNPEQAYQVGSAFGAFHSLISDVKEDLKNPLEGFHDTEKYYQGYEEAKASNPANRYQEEEISNWLNSKKEDSKLINNLVKNGKVPLRVTHNDPKINNILFDKTTKEAVSIVDWDTISKHLPVLVDWGDMCRSCCATTTEDEIDLDKINFSLEYFEELAKGYLSKAKSFLTENEKAYLLDSIKHITFELALRFYTDYLNGDKYFKVKYPTHNYDRAVNQFTLWKSIEKQEEEIKKIIKTYLED